MISKAKTHVSHRMESKQLFIKFHLHAIDRQAASSEGSAIRNGTKWAFNSISPQLHVRRSLWWDPMNYWAHLAKWNVFSSLALFSSARDDDRQLINISNQSKWAIEKLPWRDRKKQHICSARRNEKALGVNIFVWLLRLQGKATLSNVPFHRLSLS